jgi:hypothetical protein
MDGGGRGGLDDGGDRVGAVDESADDDVDDDGNDDDGEDDEGVDETTLEPGTSPVVGAAVGVDDAGVGSVPAP